MAKTVYSTRDGDSRKEPHRRLQQAEQPSTPPQQQTITLMRDKKGRKGKMVTVASGFALSATDLNKLAKTLKGMCGAGGTTKVEGGIQIIEVQGDHRDKVGEKLAELGYKVKFSGG